MVMYSTSEGLDLCDVCSDCIGCKDRGGRRICNETSNCAIGRPTDEPRDDGSASTHEMSLVLVIIMEMLLMLHFAL